MLRFWFFFSCVLLLLARPAEAACTTANCPGQPCDTFATLRQSDDHTGMLSCIVKTGYSVRDCKLSPCVLATISTPIPKRSEFEVDFVSLEGIHPECLLKEFEAKKGQTLIPPKRSVRSVSACTASCNTWCSSIKGAISGVFLGINPAVGLGVCSCTYLR